MINKTILWIEEAVFKLYLILFPEKDKQIDTSGTHVDLTKFTIENVGKKDGYDNYIDGSK